MLRAFLLLAATISVALVSAPSTDSAPGRAGGGLYNRLLSIRVINDLNENGRRDEGEPGLPDWGIYLLCGDYIEFSGQTGADGTLLYESYHEYHCVNVSVMFGWLPTSPTRVVVSIPEGGEVEVVFLVRRVGEDVHLLHGLPIADGVLADAGAALDALVDGVSCGEGALTESFGLIRYELYIVGVSERAGCAQSGQEAVLTIDGSDAGSATFSSKRREQLDLIAGATPMYFSIAFFGRLDPAAVTPYVRSTPCGQAYLQTIPLLPPSFQTVFVVSEAQEPGCGARGRVVSLKIGDEIARQVMWQEGNIASDHLRQPGDANCDEVTDSVDATVVLQYTAGLLEEIECADAANVTGDSSTNSIDAAVILQVVSGLIPYFP